VQRPRQLTSCAPGYRKVLDIDTCVLGFICDFFCAKEERDELPEFNNFDAERFESAEHAAKVLKDGAHCFGGKERVRACP